MFDAHVLAYLNSLGLYPDHKIVLMLDGSHPDLGEAVQACCEEFQLFEVY